MSLVAEKAELERRLADIQDQINTCKYEWGETVYDPEIVQQGYGSKMVGEGVDKYIEFEGYTPVPKQRWSQTCKKCGIKRYTSKTEPTAYKPKF